LEKLRFRCGVFVGVILLSAAGIRAVDGPPPVNPARPTLVPVPSAVAGVSSFVQPLGGWRSPPNLQGNFWAADVDTASWNAAPGGRGGRNGAVETSGDLTAAFRTSGTLPADWSGKRIIVRFESVGDGAKLWVNGQFVRDHWGSLMPWSADITDLVKPGQAASITVGQDQRREGLNLYVQGGGMGSASLIALPRDYLSRVHAETTFDKQYQNATLHVWLTMAFHGGRIARVKLTLIDPAGTEVKLDSAVMELAPERSDRIFDLPVANVVKWDAEHPNLYTLQATVLDADGAAAQTITKKIGLRQEEVRGNQIFINGQEVKLRGIWGGSVQQAREMNANHSRQKWVTEAYLNEADKAGLWVLDENPVDFAKFGAESDPKFAYQWMGFISDLIERDRDHPSVLLWGLGNESFNGANVLNTFKYAQLEDPQRAETFSFANRVPTDQELPYSVFSSHYPNMADPATNLADFTVAKWHSDSLPSQRKPPPVIPILHDEYGHVVQNRALIARDPNVRAFWGESLKLYWEKMFHTQGCLGGDIFGLTGGFGATANETWMVYKAYSPVRIANEPVPNPGAGNPLAVPVANWFDHTNLNEVTFDWAVGTEKGSLKGPDLAPHKAGNLSLPGRAWKDGDRVALKVTARGAVVDDFLIAVHPPKPALPTPQGPAPKLETAGAKVVITGPHFKVVFDKYRGLIDSASYDGKVILTDGPFLNLLGSGISYPEWWCDSFDARVDGNEAVVSMKGNYAVFKASFQVRIDGEGLIATKYTIDHIPGDPPPSTYSPWDANSMGGYSEVGASYMLPAATTTLTWRREGLYSTYPAAHIGRPEGTAQNGTDDFRATKEHIYQAAVNAGQGATATALSDGRDAVRLYADSNPGRSMVGGLRFCINNEWNYPDIGIGNYAKPPLLIRDGYSNTVYLKLGAK